MERALAKNEDKNLNEAVKSGHIANSKLLYEVQSDAVRRFLAANRDYFDILGPAGQVDTAYGQVKYLAKVVLGQSKAVILDYNQAWSKTEEQLALAAVLTNEWSEYRLIIIDKLGHPLYEKAPAYLWNALEMPTYSRNFFLTCFIKYQQLNLNGRTSLAWTELNNFHLVNFVINFLQDGNMLSKGLAEFEDKRREIARPQPFFADMAAAVVVGLYLSSCIDCSGETNIEFIDDLPIVKYKLKLGTLIFAAGRFAHYLLKVPSSKASLPGVVRAVISQMSNPCLCAEAEYSPYLYWQDTVQDNIDLKAVEYSLPWNKDISRNAEIPPFVEAHRRLLAKLNSRASDIRVQNNQKLYLYQYWLCPSCAQFTTSEREMDWPEKSDVTELEKSLASYTSSLDESVCGSCRNVLGAKSLQYTALSCFWLWPGAELILENGRLADGRLVRGWGFIAESEQLATDHEKWQKSRFEICQESISEQSLYEKLQRFSSLAGRTAQLLRKTEKELSCQPEHYKNVQPLGGVSELCCWYTESISTEPVQVEDVHFAECEGKTYFIFPLNLQRWTWRGLEGTNVDLSQIAKAEYRVNWLAFTNFAYKYFQDAFAKEYENIKINVSGEHSQKLQICGKESYLERDLVALVTEAFYSGSYPEAVLIKACSKDLGLFAELEAAAKLVEKLQKQGQNINFVPEQRLYSLTLKDGTQRQISFEELGKALEGPLRRTKFALTEQPLNLWHCRCGLNAGVSIEFVRADKFSNLKYYPYKEPLDYIFNDPNIKLTAEMFERYQELDSSREKAIKAAGGKSAVALVEIESLSRRRLKTAGTFQRSGQLLPSENEALYAEAFKQWFPRLDEVRLFNKQKEKSSYLAPVWAVRCPYHIVYCTPNFLPKHDLIKWHGLNMDRLGGKCTAYQFGNVWLIHGPNISFAALDPRFIRGLALAGKIRIDDFFKVSVAQSDLIILGGLETDIEEQKEAWRLFCRRFHRQETQDYFLYERACFCNIARGRFQVESRLL